MKRITERQFRQALDEAEGDLVVAANTLKTVLITDDDELDELYANFVQALEELEWRLKIV